MSLKYKLLILDYGGVYSFEYVVSNFDKIMISTFGKVPNEEERQAISEKSRLLGADKISTKEYIIMLGKILDVTQLPTTQQFEDATVAVTSPPTKEMVELVRDIQSHGVKVSLLSDMYMFEVKLTRPWGRYDGFDHTSFSAEAGITKSDPGFFKQTLNHFGVLPEETLFVDDVLSHIEVAKSVGIDTLHVDRTKYRQVDQLVPQIYNVLGL